MAAVKVKVELPDDAEVYVTQTMSWGYTHAIQVEAEAFDLSIYGTKDQLLKFQKSLNESIDQLIKK